jgi:hypothetical protein
LYAPVVVNYEVVGPDFVYTPAYAVTDTIVLDSLFIRPCCCHYYFGDYYGVRYHSLGFESCVVYSRCNYDSIIVYERYERRSDPAWLSVQIDLCSRRDRGLAPCPPRTLVQQNIVQNNVNIVNNTTVVNNNIVNNNVTNNVTKNNVTNNKTVNNTTVLMPASKLAAAKNIQTVKLDSAARNQALQRSQAVQQVAMQRSRAEMASPGIPTRPRQASLKLPPVQPVRAAGERRITPTTPNITAGQRNSAANLRTGPSATNNARPVPPGYNPPGRPATATPNNRPPLARPGAIPPRPPVRPPVNRPPPPNRRPPDRRPPNGP